MPSPSQHPPLPPFSDFYVVKGQAIAWEACFHALFPHGPSQHSFRHPEAFNGMQTAVAEIQRLQQCASELAKLSLAKGKANGGAAPAPSAALLQSQLAIALQSLTALACFHDSGANASLKFTGDYSCFDEPSAVWASRVALLQIEALGLGLSLPVTIASATKGTSE